MPEENYNMWRYWRDKYGHVLGLADYYPKLVEDRKDLQMAIAMIENGERIIDSVMEELDTG